SVAFEDATEMTHIWLVSLGLAFISYICSVHSQMGCRDDSQCHGRKCCLGHCSWRRVCPCMRDTDCSSGEACFLPGHSCRTIATQSPKTTVHSLSPDTNSTPNTASSGNCVRDSECEGSSVCKHGQCVYNHRSGNTVQNTWSRSETTVVVICFVVSIFIVTLYFLCKRAVKRPVLAPQNSPTRVTRGTATRAAHQEMQPGRASVIFVDEDALPLPLGSPPPYHSLEFERQLNEIDEPPSYEDAVRGTTIPAVA
ncbi:hypothetical protein ACROYT_G036474, partial [Oculina patagonica]